jgi:hypothetical protein
MKIPAEKIQTRFFDNIYKQSVEKANLKVPFDNLDYGRKILENEEECQRYIALYGGHHFHKLWLAFSSTNFKYVSQKNIEIIDWGCGQAIATCILIDYLIENQIDTDVVKITLIEPSEVATEKGKELITQMFQSNKSVTDIINVVNKKIDELAPEDFETQDDNIKIHLFSNIIDVEVFDVKNFYELIVRAFKGLNRMICTSPKNSPKRTARLDYFYKLFSDNHTVNLPFNSDADINEKVFVVGSGNYEEYTIKRYEIQFTVDLPPF